MFTCEFCFVSVPNGVYTYHLVTEHNQPKPEGYVEPSWGKQDKSVYTDGEIVSIGEVGDSYGD